MLTVRQIDLLYESIGSTRSKFHKLNVTFHADQWSTVNIRLLLLEGKETRCSCFTESCK